MATIYKFKRKTFGFNPLTAFGAFGKSGNFAKAASAFGKGNIGAGLGQAAKGTAKTALIASPVIGAAAIGSGISSVADKIDN